nr:hypothetical protein [Tanacetum cinerariifolium]
MGFYKQNSLQSKFDQTSRISKSVFVSNFPEGCTPKDLWKVCNDYGTVVDVFIPNKKSKAGKRFAFVRFIKVINLDRLIENLNTTWIGRFHLFANHVRFERPKKLVSQLIKICMRPLVIQRGFRQPKARDHAGSYVNVVNGSSTAAVPGLCISFASALVLDDSCVVERDLSKYAMGKVKDVNSIPNLWTLLMDEGFSDVELKYLGGIPLNVWSRETFMRIGKKWGETLDIEDNVDSSFGRKRLCIKTKQPVSILESFKIIFKAHSPFSEEVSGDDSESDVDEVSETIFGDNSSSPNNNSDEMGKQHFEDPFKIYDRLKKQTGGETREVSSSLSHPPGFTPEVSEIRKENDQGAEDFPSESVDPNVVKEGGSVLEVLEDMVRVGQAMGYTMDGCVKDFERIIGTQGADDEKEKLLNKIKEFDEATTRNSGNILINSQRSDWVGKLHNIERKEHLNISQQAKVRWEIHAAICDCGSEKSPGPNGFTFAFYKKLWDLIKSDVIAFVQDFLNTSTMPKGCNSSFIALIPKISNPMV